MRRSASLIVVVDDDPTIRSLICHVLRQADYRVREADDGVLALAEVANERPTLTESTRSRSLPPRFLHEGFP